MSSAVLALLLLLAGPAHAGKTVVVSGDGSGDFRTVEEAHRVAVEGDSVLLRGRAPGADGAWDLPARGGLSYVGEGQAAVRGVKILRARGIRIARLRVRGPILIYFSEGIVVEDSLVENPASLAPGSALGETEHLGLVDIFGSQDVTLRRCRIQEHAGRGVTVFDSAGVAIEDNVIARNWRGGVAVDLPMRRGRVAILGNTIVYNQFLQPDHDSREYAREVRATLAGARRDPVAQPSDLVAAGEEAGWGSGVLAGVLADKQSVLVVARNIVAFNDIGILVDARAARALEAAPPARNVCFGNRKVDFGFFRSGRSRLVLEDASREPGVTKDNLIGADPLLLDPDAGDYRLRPESPARGAPLAGGGAGAPAEVAAPGFQAGR